MRTSYAILILLSIAIILTYTLGSFYAYFYPMTYSDEIIKYSELNNVDSALVASVINTESGFNRNSKSSKGALGLMQLMPSTAQWIASKLNLEYKEKDLFNVEYNINLGSYYLNYLINYFGDEKLGLCAYNAGQGNVSNWLKDETYSNDGKSLIKIPYKETENYLNKVYKNYHYYKNKYK